MTKEEYKKEITEKFDNKLSISFWSVIFWNALQKGEISEMEIWDLLREINKNET